MFSFFFQSGRVTRSFLDAELIEVTAPAADDAAIGGDIDASLAPLYGDGVHLQHWPNHDNHIHVRLSEEAYASDANKTRATVDWAAVDQAP